MKITFKILQILSIAVFGTTLFCPTIFAYDFVYGPGLGFDTKANIPVGEAGRKTAIRFKAITPSTVTYVRWVQRGGPVYSLGTGGTITVSLQADDGSGHPSGTSLASGTWAGGNPGGHWETYVNTSLTGSPTLTVGNFYYIVFTNPSTSNYISINHVYCYNYITPRQPMWADADFGILDTTGAWGSIEGGYTPVCDITYGNGLHSGNAYYEAMIDRYTTIGGSGNGKARELFTVSGGSRTVTGAYVRVRRTSGTDPLYVALAQDGVILDEFTIAASGVPITAPGGDDGGAVWVGDDFPSSHTLANGSTYTLTLSAAVSTIYTTHPVRSGSDKGFNSWSFPDGRGQKATDGVSWVEMYDWSHADMQCYFTTSIVISSNTLPIVSIISPIHGSTVATTVEITAIANDDNGISKVIFYIDGISKSTDTTAPYSWSWDTTQYSNGAHTLKVVAYNTTGQTAAIQNVVTVNNTVVVDDPPTVSIVSPVNGPPVSATVSIAANASDDKGISRVIFYIDEISKSTDTTTPFSWSWDTTQYINGSHKIKVIAYDTINQTANAEITVVKLSSGSAAGTGSITGCVYNVTTLQKVVGTTCTLAGLQNGTTVTDNNGQYSFTGLVAGTYTITATATEYDPQMQVKYISTTQMLNNIFLTPTGSGLRISGYIQKDGIGVNGIQVNWAASQQSDTRVTDSNGYYEFNGLISTNCMITISTTGYTPADHVYGPLTQNQDNQNFTKFTATVSCTADFTAAIVTGDKPLTVQFIDSSTGTITSWDWSFGDDSSSIKRNPAHTYNSTGTFTVTLTVSGPGGTNIKTKVNYITVTSPALPTLVVVANRVSENEAVVWNNMIEPGKDNAKIVFNLGSDSAVKIRVYNILGELVKEYDEKRYSSGVNQESWDGKDSDNTTLPSGLYLVHIKTSSWEKVCRIIIKRR
ncbi:MAG: Ig-like domain-containing protein [Elusimicrobiota bacterium]